MAVAEIPFLEEARNLADEDHFLIDRELDNLRHDSETTLADLNYVRWEHNFRDDREEYFEANRDYYLEKAREMFADWGWELCA